MDFRRQDGMFATAAEQDLIGALCNNVEHLFWNANAEHSSIFVTDLTLQFADINNK